MAPRRRAVETASLRRKVTDRVVVVLVAVIAASGLMSLLPGSGQASVRRVICQAGSLGLSSCTRSTLALGAGRLSPPRCSVLASLDAVLPEVRVSRLTSQGGLPVEVSSARSGQVTLRLGTDSAPPPFLLEGETRASRPLVPGAAVPAAAEWTFASDQGADGVVDAVTDAHQQWLTRRSSLAVLFGALGGDGVEIPAPTVTYSQLSLAQRVLPGTAVLPAAPTKAPASASRSAVTLDVSVPAVLQHDSSLAEVAVVARVSGTVSGWPVDGWLRWSRGADGNIRNVLLALVSTHALVPGEPTPAPGTVGVSYVAVPVRTAPEQALVQTWFGGRAPLRVGLDQVLRLKPVDPSDQVTTFLSRAASVTSVHVPAADVATARERVHDELVTLRRTEWAGGAPLFAGRVDPQPGGAVRQLVVDRSCTS